MLIGADDPGLIERFFTEALDFRTGERVIDSMENPERIAVWLTAEESHSAHDIAVLKGPDGKIHHFAYHLDDWSSILRAADIFSMDDVPIDIGPTRHGVTRGETIYFFDPAGNRNEVFAGLERRIQKDHPTINWTTDQLGKAVFYHSRELNERFTTVFT